MAKNRLVLPAALLTLFILCGCGVRTAIPEKPKEIDGLEFEESVEGEYAEQFKIDRYKGGYSMIYTTESAYLVVPENGDVPQNIDAKIIKQPAKNIYLAAPAVMTFFDRLGKGGSIRFSGTRLSDWHIDYAKRAMESGDMLYAGKYREPDYELLLSGGCPLAVESTMILHAPEVREKLEEIGITVFTDYSSHEPHPLGRSEWIKVYGEITDREDEADALFKEQAKYLSSEFADTGKTAVYFYVNSAGQPVVRRSGDYITKMIELAGGHNVLQDVGGGESAAAVNMEAEEFYIKAKDADFIIYDASIGGGVSNIDELVSRLSQLADFKAVKTGNVWCAEKSLFQETMKSGEIIAELNAVFTGRADENPPENLTRVKDGGAGE